VSRGRDRKERILEASEEVENKRTMQGRRFRRGGGRIEVRYKRGGGFSTEDKPTSPKKSSLSSTQGGKSHKPQRKRSAGTATCPLGEKEDPSAHRIEPQ